MSEAEFPIGNFHQFERLLARVALATNFQPNGNWINFVLVYFEELSDYSRKHPFDINFDLIKEAVSNHLRSEKSFPKICEIIDQAETIFANLGL